MGQSSDAHSFADEREIENTQFGALGKSRKAVDGESGLRSNKDLEVLFGAAKESGGFRLGTLMNDVLEIQDTDEACQFAFLNVKIHGRADSADKRIEVGALQVGCLVQTRDGDVVPLAFNKAESPQDRLGVLSARNVGQDLEENLVGQMLGLLAGLGGLVFGRD